MSKIIDSVHPVTIVAIGFISMTDAEILAKIICAAVPAAVATAYTIWKWKKESKK